jgi:hypothetical protein
VEVYVSACLSRVYVCWVDFGRIKVCVLFECCERWYAAISLLVMYMWCEFRGFWLSGFVLCMEKCVPAFT